MRLTTSLLLRLGFSIVSLRLPSAEVAWALVVSGPVFTAFGKLGIQGWMIRRDTESHGIRHRLPLKILSRGPEHVYLHNFALDGAWSVADLFISL
jgi:hypothetical protein